MRGLKDRIAVVTGGGQGIGRALTLRLAEEGCKVAIFDLKLDAAHETQKLAPEGRIFVRAAAELGRRHPQMAEDGVTFSAGAATFLTDMCEAVIHGAPRPPRLRKFLCAGAPIPPVSIERVHREIGAVVARSGA